jgi:hypothetical protein
MPDLARPFSRLQSTQNPSPSGEGRLNHPGRGRHRARVDRVSIWFVPARCPDALASDARILLRNHAPAMTWRGTGGSGEVLRLLLRKVRLNAGVNGDAILKFVSESAPDRGTATVSHSAAPRREKPRLLA